MDVPPPVRVSQSRKAAWTLMDQGCVSAVNFLIVVLLARSLTLTEFGVVMLAQMLLLLFTTMQNSAVTQPHNILGAQLQERKFAGLTFALGVLQGSLAFGLAIVSAIAGLALWQAGAIDYARIGFAMAAIVVPMAGQEFARRVLYTLSDSRGAAVNDFIAYGLQLACMIALTQFDIVAATPVTALLALGCGSAAGAVVGGWQLRRFLNKRDLMHVPERQSWAAFKATSKESWGLSKWLVAQQGVTWIGANGYGWLLAALLGPASVGVYRAAYQIVNVLNPLRQAAMNYLPSHAARVFSQEGAEGVDRWRRAAIWRLVLPFIACAIVVAAAAEPLARVFYGRELDIPNVQLLVALGAFAYAINFWRTPLDYAVLVIGGARALFLRAVWLAVLALSAGAALIWSAEIYGAFFAEVLSAIAALTFTLRVYARQQVELRVERQAEHRSAKAPMSDRELPARERSPQSDLDLPAVGTHS